MHLTRENAISSHRDFWARIVRYVRKTKIGDLPARTNSKYSKFVISDLKKRVSTSYETIDLTNSCYLCEYLNTNCQSCATIIDINCNIYGSAWHELVYNTKTKKDLLKHCIAIRDAKEYSC